MELFLQGDALEGFVDELCPFVGHILWIEGFFIEQVGQVRTAAFEKERIERLAGNAGDPAKIKAELDEAESIEGFFGL